MTTELIFHGTGASSCLPNISCLTLPADEGRCEACHLGANPGIAADPVEALKNRRRNTGAILRVTNEHGKQITVVIDAGKSFVAAALDWFPKYGLRRIDALVLTHAHADAMNGLDDLRCWTLGGAVQENIEIYLSQRTYDEVQRTFPYLVNKGMATGGGSVPEFQWNIISEFVEFDIQGIKITPLPVHHGRYFGPVKDLISPLLTPPLSPPMSPTRSRNHSRAPSTHGMALSTIPEVLSQSYFTLSPRREQSGPLPYVCFGFLFPHFVYMSDVSDIPPCVLSFLDALPERKKPEVAIVDCLRPAPHQSHFGIEKAVAAAHRLGAERTYLIGFMCSGKDQWITHEGWVGICEAISEGRREVVNWTGHQAEIARCQEAVDLGNRARAEPGCWIRPSFDGLRIMVDDQGVVKDGAYD